MASKCQTWREEDGFIAIERLSVMGQTSEGLRHWAEMLIFCLSGHFCIDLLSFYRGAWKHEPACYIGTCGNMSMHVSLYRDMWKHGHARSVLGSQRITWWSQFSPSTKCIPGMELGSSGLIASVFPCWAILLSSLWVSSSSEPEEIWRSPSMFLRTTEFRGSQDPLEYHLSFPFHNLFVPNIPIQAGCGYTSI